MAKLHCIWLVVKTIQRLPCNQFLWWVFTQRTLKYILTKSTTFIYKKITHKFHLKQWIYCCMFLRLLNKEKKLWWSLFNTSLNFTTQKRNFSFPGFIQFEYQIKWLWRHNFQLQLAFVLLCICLIFKKTVCSFVHLYN